VNPNTIIEALSAGKPFICTTGTGLNTKVREVGIYLDPLDEMAWRDGIVSLLDTERYENEKKKLDAFSYVRTWDDVTNDILSVFQKG
jgi:glycosyltransferase involved in cell wall biosynthesis